MLTRKHWRTFKKRPRDYTEGFEINAKRPRSEETGWLAPGRNYMGPNNPIDRKYAPQSFGDKKAFNHDISEEYKDPHAYYEWNEADQDFIDQDAEDWQDVVANTFFRIKKAASRIGAIKRQAPLKALVWKPSGMDIEELQKKRRRINSGTSLFNLPCQSGNGTIILV